MTQAYMNNNILYAISRTRILSSTSFFMFVKFVILFLTSSFIFVTPLFAQSNTSASGNWNTAGNWSAGVPTGATNANVNHTMTINTNISISTGDYTINQSVVDAVGGTVYSLSISGTGGNQGNFDVHATSSFEGTCSVNSNGTLTVRSGDTLSVGAAIFANNCTVVVEAGGTLIINGDLTNNNNSTGIAIDGTLIVNGNFTGGNGSQVNGVGTMSTTGTLVTTGSGSVFGSTGDCNTGPCSGNNACAATNTIGTSQSICSGTTPVGLTGSAMLTYTFQWQSSTTSSSAGFTNITLAATQNYAPLTLTVSTWYRRVATLGGCSAASVAVKITITPQSWLGGTSTNWNTASNWCGGLPTSATDIIIPSGTTFSAVITGIADVKNLTVNPSATLTKSATGVLNINGNLLNNGVFTDNGIYTNTGVINFAGTTAQTISGVTAFNNLTINNSSGVTLSSTASLKGILTLTAGTFVTNGNLTVDLYTGAIAGTGIGVTTGNIIFTKAIWGDRYHYLSSPITARTVADWNDNVPLKTGANSNLYYYNETAADTNRLVGWTALSSTATVLNDMKGYALYFPRFIYNTNLDITGPYNHAAGFTTGTLTNTPSTIPVFKAASDGWNLIGNPYPSTIDWDAASGLTRVNVGGAYYTWDARLNRYSSYVATVGTNGGTRYIGSMQGFFVKVSTSGGSGSVALTNAARITTVMKDVWRVSSPEKLLRLTAGSASVNDETVIRFSEVATEAFDDQLDAYKLMNGSSAPSLYSTSSSEEYSVNSLPIGQGNKTISLQLSVPSNELYSLTASLSNFAASDSVWLEDRLLQTTQDMRLKSDYAVQLNKGTYKDRFFVHYKEQASEAVNILSSSPSIQIAGSEHTVVILFLNQNIEKADVTIFDALGRPLLDLKGQSISENKIELGVNALTSGIYNVKVQTQQAYKSQQIFLEK